MQAQIEEITSEETIAIRHQVMWPGKSIDYVRLPQDNKGRHFGLFIDKKLIAVISLFITDNEAQFRKFATLSSYQRKGYGSQLLKEIMSLAKHHRLDKIWCNARVDKSAYYAKFGMYLTDKRFEKGGIEYVVMEKKL